MKGNPLQREPFFHEEQRFRQAWLWIVLGGVCLLELCTFGYGMAQQVILGHTWGDRPLSNSALLFVSATVIFASLGILYLFLHLRLMTEVHEDGLYFRFFPLHLKFYRIGADELQRWEAVTYSPLLEYGGWGIRYGMKGKAYNVSGNRGVRLELRDGRRILFGSQKPEEFAASLDRIAQRQ